MLPVLYVPSWCPQSTMGSTSLWSSHRDGTTPHHVATDTEYWSCICRPKVLVRFVHMLKPYVQVEGLATESISFCIRRLLKSIKQFVNFNTGWFYLGRNGSPAPSLPGSSRPACPRRFSCFADFRCCCYVHPDIGAVARCCAKCHSQSRSGIL